MEIEPIKKPEEFTTFDNYIIIPTINLEQINDSLLRFYKKNKIEIKFRLHSKSEYEFSGKIIEMYGLEEEGKEDEEEEKKEEKLRKASIKNTTDSLTTTVGYIPSPIYYSHQGYIILEDNKNNRIKLFLTDIDHRTIMPKDVQVVKPFYFFEREPIPPQLRFEVLERDYHTCQYCGRKPPEVILEVDHIIPVSKGGKTEKSNLITSCRDCNIGKSNKTIVG